MFGSLYVGFCGCFHHFDDDLIECVDFQLTKTDVDVFSAASCICKPLKKTYETLYAAKRIWASASKIFSHFELKRWWHYCSIWSIIHDFSGTVWVEKSKPSITRRPGSKDKSTCRCIRIGTLGTTTDSEPRGRNAQSVRKRLQNRIQLTAQQN